jgi:hypothetical protein
MKLLTKEILAKLPPLGSQSDDSDPVIQCKFFTADAGWTWYVVDGSPEPETGDFIFFGYVVGPCPEWGNFSLNELQSVRGALGLPVERDLHFRRQRFSELPLPF